MQFYHDVYKESLKVISGINDHAMFILKLFKLKRMKNCKVLARKIKSYKIRKIIKTLLIDLKKYKKFFQVSYKGFYCSICDARVQRFVDMNDKSLIFSKSFCRKMLKDSFHVLKYFGNNFAELINLLMAFATSCDYKGTYRELDFPDTLRFEENPKLEAELNKC